MAGRSRGRILYSCEMLVILWNWQCAIVKKVPTNWFSWILLQQQKKERHSRNWYGRLQPISISPLLLGEEYILQMMCVYCSTMGQIRFRLILRLYNGRD